MHSEHAAAVVADVVAAAVVADVVAVVVAARYFWPCPSIDTNQISVDPSLSLFMFEGLFVPFLSLVYVFLFMCECVYFSLSVFVRLYGHECVYFCVFAG